MRTVPALFEEKRAHWIELSNRWYNIHNVTGGSSAFLSVMIAINAKNSFLTPTWAMIAAGAAAVLTFLVTALHAEIKGKAFTLASRELEAAISVYVADDSLPESYLAKAQVRGIEILNKNGAV